MANLVEWIETLANGEPIIGVVIGRTGWASEYDEDETNDYGSDKIPAYSSQKHNVLVTWEEAKPMLNYEFDSGYGSPGCNAITVWTTNWIIAVSQYDGATAPFRLPRNPVNHIPCMPGG